MFQTTNQKLSKHDSSKDLKVSTFAALLWENVLCGHQEDLNNLPTLAKQIT
jgi:hypothetical protein